MLGRRRLLSTLARAFHLDVGKVAATPGGSLKVRLSKPCTLNITPLNPHTSDWNHVHVAVQVNGSKDSSTESESVKRELLESLGLILDSHDKQDRSYVRLESVPRSATGTKSDLQEDLHVDVSLPGLFDLDVDLHYGAVNIIGTIEGDVKIRCEDAAVNIEKLKSMNVNVESNAGGVSASVLQGSIAIRAGTGDICIGKMQGPCVTLESTSGCVQAGAMYAENACVRTGLGSVNVKGAQGSTKILTGQGNVHVAGVQGDLTVESESGDVNAHLSLPEKISILSRSGNVSVGVSEQSQIKAVMTLQGRKGIQIDNEVNFKEQAKDADSHSLHGLFVSRPHDSKSHLASIDSTTQVRKIEARSPSGKLRLYVEKWTSRFTNKLP